VKSLPLSAAAPAGPAAVFGLATMSRAFAQLRAGDFRPRIDPSSAQCCPPGHVIFGSAKADVVVVVVGPIVVEIEDARVVLGVPVAASDERIA